MKGFLNTNTSESIAAFFTGGIPATILSFNLFEGVVFPMLLAAITGLLGGGFALLGKDLYKFLKSRLRNEDK
mgnify:FL=1|tara:strand:+ start:10697 stop:10912 length:216 start_codon:yes stop_codon:yes gene_type:complete